MSRIEPQRDELPEIHTKKKSKKKKATATPTTTTKKSSKKSSSSRSSSKLTGGGGEERKSRRRSDKHHHRSASTASPHNHTAFAPLSPHRDASHAASHSPPPPSPLPLCSTSSPQHPHQHHHNGAHRSAASSRSKSSKSARHSALDTHSEYPSAERLSHPSINTGAGHLAQLEPVRNSSRQHEQSSASGESEPAYAVVHQTQRAHHQHAIATPTGRVDRVQHAHARSTLLHDSLEDYLLDDEAQSSDASEDALASGSSGDEHRNGGVVRPHRAAVAGDRSHAGLLPSSALAPRAAVVAALIADDEDVLESHSAVSPSAARPHHRSTSSSSSSRQHQHQHHPHQPHHHHHHHHHRQPQQRSRHQLTAGQPTNSDALSLSPLSRSDRQQLSQTGGITASPNRSASLLISPAATLLPTVFVSEPPSSLKCPLCADVLVDPVISASCGHSFCRNCANTSSGMCPLDGEDLLTSTLIPNRALASQTRALLIYCKNGLREVSSSRVSTSRSPSTPQAEITEDKRTSSSASSRTQAEQLAPSNSSPATDGKARTRRATTTTTTELSTKAVAKVWERDPDGCSKEIPWCDRHTHESVCLFGPVRCENCEQDMRRWQLEDHLLHCDSAPCPHQQFGCEFHGTLSEMSAHLATCTYEKLKGYLGKQHLELQELKTMLKQDHLDVRRSNLALDTKMDMVLQLVQVRQTQEVRLLRDVTRTLRDTQKQLAAALQELALLRGQVLSGGGPVQMGQPVRTTTRPWRCKGTFIGHIGPVWSLCIAPGGEDLISGSSDSSIRIWSIDSSKCKHILDGHTEIVHAVVMDGSRIYSGSSDKSIKVWSNETKKCIKTLSDHSNIVCKLLLANGHLFSGSYMEIKVWNLDTFECVTTLRGHNHWVRSLTCAGKLLFSGAYNTIKVWDLDTLECRNTFTGHYGSIYALVVADDRLFAGTYENAINVFDLNSFECVETLTGHQGAVYSLCICGKRLFSGSYDNTIRVWHLRTLQCVQTLVRHTSSVDALIAHPEDRCVFSASADNSIKVWR